MNYPHKPGIDLDNLDPRVFLVILPVMLGIVITWMGDRAAFIRPPLNEVENICAVLPATGYTFFKDRILADAFSIALILALLAIVMIPFLVVIGKRIKFQQMKKMHKEQKAEAKIMQDLHEKDS
jgi:hypothetical protein